MHELIITEKPQAAMKIASALGDERKLTENGVSYYQVERNNEKIIVASAVGHLYNLNYVKGQKGWPIFDLEWIPSYDRKSAAFTKKYFMLLKKLSKRAKEYVVATDFDNEGEVIGWNVLRFVAELQTAKRMKYSTKWAILRIMKSCQSMVAARRVGREEKANITSIQMRTGIQGVIFFLIFIPVYFNPPGVTGEREARIRR